MVGWICQAAHWTEPIYKRIRQKLLASGYGQVDETPIRYHDPSAKKGHTEQGYFWSLSAPGGDVVFKWQETRQFYEAREEAPEQADFVLDLIGSLYADERRWNETGVSATDRSALRKTEWTPRLAWLRRAALGLRQDVLPKSRLGLACQYLLNQWDALVAHLEHGRTRIDNNCAENTIRPAKLGMKNWRFIGHPDAGQRSAILYSPVISCKRHGKDPLAYLRDVLTRLPTMTNLDDLDPLLPSNWTPTSAPA